MNWDIIPKWSVPEWSSVVGTLVAVVVPVVCWIYRKLLCRGVFWIINKFRRRLPTKEELTENAGHLQGRYFVLGAITWSLIEIPKERRGSIFSSTLSFPPFNTKSTIKTDVDLGKHIREYSRKQVPIEAYRNNRHKWVNKTVLCSQSGFVPASLLVEQPLTLTNPQRYRLQLRELKPEEMFGYVQEKSA
jgi:hypothetical protein